VGLNAVAISMELTQGAVITAGIDFSFTMDSYHARSTPGHLARLRRQNRFTGLLNAQAAFGQSVFRAVSKTGTTVFSNPAMRNYRDLFEGAFAVSSPRLFDITGSGLPLGVKTLSTEEAFGLLTSGGNEVNNQYNNIKLTLTKANTNLLTGGDMMVNEQSAAKLRNFVLAEIDRLTSLRNILTGSVSMDYNSLADYIDECDYLWAHFPDYAASSRRPDKAELEAGGQAAVSFLNRLRAEIDPFLSLFLANSSLKWYN
jgi:hypothetical protein